jgi:hypothetical protein
LPRRVYQGRATHCVASIDALYVLVQMDTDSHALTDQTVLEVVKLDRFTGRVTARSGFVGPDTATACTAWVDEGAGHFTFERRKLIISGRCDPMSDWSDPTARGARTRRFAIALSPELRPVRS